MKITVHFVCLLVLFVQFALAQHTVGLLSYQPNKSFDGYNLLYPHNQPNVYLLDNCGEIVHTWPDDNSWRPGNTAYILENGNLVKSKRLAAVAGNPIWTGGGGAIIEMRDWDNNLLWSFEMNDSLQRLHHDFDLMPNGHILAIAWERKTVDEAVQAGRNPALLPNSVLWPDKVVEVDPSTGTVVWEWHTWDHLIQDFDATKDNYGTVSDHPELVDLNWDFNNGASWMHTNAIDYDPINDLIMISSPTFSEIWILDHSTSTAQAASHSGGFGGRGGDLLYRWGNPAAYKSGTAADQTLFFQHNPHWIDEFVDEFHPLYGKIAVFNNRAGSNFSTANAFTPPFDMYTTTFPMTGNTWGPTAFDWTFTYPGDPTKMYSTGLSSVEHLPNGNVLLLSGQRGYAFEVTPDNEIVWEYVTPFKNGVPLAQGDTSLHLNDNQTFRIKRYPADFPAFAGKDLSEKGWIELNPDSSFCDQLLPASEAVSNYQIKIYPNPANQMATIEWAGGGVYVDMDIYDWLGRKIKRDRHVTGGRKYLDTSNWQPGLYFIQINHQQAGKLLISR
jgi:hypothetical protein